MHAVKWTITKPIIRLLIFLFFLTACTQPIETTPEEEPSPPQVLPTITPTIAEPTATPQPAAAVVNGERIPLDAFEREVERYLLAQNALGNQNPDLDHARETVLNDLVEQVLLAQGAREAGAEFGEAEVQARLDELEEDVDLEAWMAAWGYTRDELFESLRLQMLVADQRQRIADTIPETVEQVELQQVLAFTEEGARRALAKLNSGTPFEDVAFEFKPETGGYLGWVPRGYLLISVVEEAAFDLAVGSYSEIIASDIGYHIVLVIDRDVRPLSADARVTLTRQAVYDWLADKRANSVIEIIID